MAGLRIRIAMVSALFGAMQLGAVQVAAAADYSPPPPPPPPPMVYVPQQPVVQEFTSGWYLRGDIGFSNQSVKNVTNINDVNNAVTDVGFGFDGAPLFGLGVGMYFNDWLRFDVTGEYRSRSNFHGSQIITSMGNTYTDEYSASKSEWLGLLNAYVDLGTWSGITPFVGAGVGFARNTIHSFRDVCTSCSPAPGVAFADTASKTNFAWALHAGIAYKVTKNFTVELAYRYVDLGDAESGDIYTYLGGNLVVNPMQFKKLSSHDIKVGFRYNFDEGMDWWRSRPCCAMAPAPVYTQPAPVYSPPAPVYAPPVYQPPVYQPAPVYQPPLRSRG